MMNSARSRGSTFYRIIKNLENRFHDIVSIIVVISVFRSTVDQVISQLFKTVKIRG